MSINLEGVDRAALQTKLTPRLTKYIPFEPTPKQAAFLLMNNSKEILYGGAAGGGKALTLTTPILTLNGWMTMETLSIGTKVFDEEGSICNVIAKSDIQYNHKVYRVHFDNREYIDADAEHIWTLHQYYNRPCNKEVTTQQIVDTMGKRTNHAISVTKPIKGLSRDLKVPPYTLGAWLGDGCKGRGEIASQDQEIYDEISLDGFECIKNNHECYTVYGLHTGLRILGVLNSKYIPEEYLYASYKQRLALLQGLMDTDGNASTDKGYCSICMVQEELMKQIEFLVRSLGIKVTLTTSIATCTNSKNNYTCPKYNLKWTTEQPMFRLAYKLKRQKREGFRGTQKLHYIKKVEEILSVPVQCIKVDSPNSLFLAGRALIPTHNSVAQLMAALQYVDVPGYSAILFRKSYADLALPGALIDMSKQWLMPFVERKEVKWSEKDKQYTFPSGASLNFGYLESANDCYRYQGAEFQYVGMDEVTHIDPMNYRYLFSRLRKKKTLHVPIRFRATANPGGLFGEYYYQRFFIEGPDKGRIFIGAGLDDNPHIDGDAYKESLAELDPIERERLLNGNWEIKAQGDLFSRHWFTIIPSYEIPTGISSVRFWDFASTDPKKRKTRNKRDPDWTVGLKLSHYQGMYWIEDIARVQLTPQGVEDLVRETAINDGYSVAIRIEQEPGSSGAITIDHYSRNVLRGYDCLGVLSSGSKPDRARAASAASQAGRVLISNQSRNILAFFDEADLFPYGLKDDTIDGFSGAFNYFRSPGVVRAPTGIKKSGGSYWSKLRRN
jgi:phage terminase large subunit-like protein